MTNATLQAWALSKGLDADMQSMSQMEKTMLRYQYVLQNTSAAHSDFSRTSDSWANQLRILNQQFEQLGGIVGGVLINAFKPFISTLNSVMKSVIAFAKTVANALGAIFGWTIEINSGGLATDFEAAGAGAEEMDKGTGGAAKNLKDMNKYIAAWHEVNNMTTSDDSAGGGGGTGGGGGAAGDLGEAAEAQFKRTESILEKYKSQIDSLYGLGAYIGQVLTSTMKGIDWNSIYKSASGFGTGLAQFLNGLISPSLFGEIGKTVANSLNTSLYFLNSFGKEFNWKNFGLSIAEGINSFFRNFKFSLLADTINVWAKGILDSMITALQNIEWLEIGISIGNFLLDIDFIDIGAKIVQAIWEAINGAFKLYKGMLETAPLETAILTLIGTVKLLNSDAFSGLLGSIGKVDDGLKVLTGAFGTLKNNISDKGFFSGIAASLSEWGSKLTTVQSYAVTAAAAFVEFIVVKNTIHDLITGTGSVLTNLLELGVGAATASAAMYAALGPAGLAIAAITAIIAGISAIGQATNEELARQFEEFQEKIGSNVDTLNESTEALKDLDVVQKEYIKNANTDAKELGNLADSYFELADKTTLTRDEQEQLKEYADKLIEQCPLLAGAIDDVTGRYTAQKDEIYKLIQAQQEQMQADAYKKLSQEYSDALKREQIELEVSRKQYSANGESLKKLAELQEDFKSSTKSPTEWAEDNRAALEQYGITLDGTEPAVSQLYKTSEFLTQEQIELSNAIRDGETAVTNASIALDTVNEKMDEHEKKQKELTRSSAEYQQALSDLKNELSDMNISLSEDFMGNLAENGFDSSGLKRYFDSITQGVSASSESLKRLFSDMGLSLPQELLTRLEGQEAESQAAAVRVLMGIQSGVQATEPQLKELFSNLGIEVVPELIKSMEGQNSTVQTTTINLLTKMEQGEKLVKENLVLLFSNLGMSVPNELIESMVKMDGPVQKQTIELLSQIAAGHDYTKDELLSMFNDLGLELPESLQSAMESMNDNTFQQALDLLGQVITATDEERGPLIEALKQLGIDLSEMGFTPGIKSGESSVISASEGLVNTVKSTIKIKSEEIFSKVMELGKSIVEGYAKGISDNSDLAARATEEMADKSYLAPKKSLKINSPSKLFAQLGQYVVEGFNQGIENESESSYDLMSQFASNLEKNFGHPSLDLSIPKKEDYIPSIPDSGFSQFKSTIQMEMDAKMASLEFENRQLRETLEEILVELKNKKLIVGDRDIFNANRRETIKFGNRTQKDPYPIYGKTR